MAKEFNRSDRVADVIQRSLASLIPKEVRDPRVGMVNINAVDVVRDLSAAKVYVTFVGEDDLQACKASVEILNKVANYLRNQLGRELTMRSVPRLQFIYDESTLRGQQLSHLIDKALASDKPHQADEE